MLNPEEAQKLQGQTVVASGGEEIGAIEDVYVNSSDDRPAWAVVRAESKLVPVPMDGAHFGEDAVQVRYDHDTITSAPEAHDGEELLPQSEDALYDHYDIHDSAMRDDTGKPADLEQPL